jgi:peptidyl-prolyl cis-trans isomerase C
MKLPISLALIATSALISFSAIAEDAKPEADVKPAAAADVKPFKDYVIINLGGDEIKLSEVLEIWKGLFQGDTAPDFTTFDESVKQNVLRGIISERLIYKDALKAGVDKKDDVKKRIENLQKQVIMQSFMEEKAKTLVTDDQLKSAYDAKLKANEGAEELKASHILVPTEEEAKKIAEKLKKGGDFAKIAKEKSADKGSGAKGGDLGWFTKEKMVAEFADAAFKLKKGEVSAPVKSSFGWHIIKLEDRRPVKPATFEESKDALKNEATGKAVQAYVESLLKGASIKYLDESGKEKDFTRELSKPKAEEKPAEKPADAAAPKAEEKK